MSENNLEIASQRLPINDGSEILERAQRDNSKGLTRRDFLKLSGYATGAVTAGYFLGHIPELPNLSEISETNIETSSPPEISLPKEKYLHPKLVHNVEVYGLTEKINSEDQIDNLYKYIDEKYASENSIRIEDKIEQRKELLNPNKRYLEVVVRQSAYESFIDRQEETGVDFVEWIQMHVDINNRCFENATPPVDLKAVLRRIIVIDDSLPKDWDESAWLQGEGKALDIWYKDRFLNNLPLDTDTTWAIATDYRVDTRNEESQGNFWSFIHQDGKTIFGQPPGANQYDITYEFTDKDDSLSGHDNVWLDMGLTHEWSHYLFDAPDEYIFDEQTPYRFINVPFDTGYVGAYHEPSLSPFLSYILNKNLADRQRGYTHEEEAFILPDSIMLNIPGIENVDFYVPKMPDSYYDDRKFPFKPTYSDKNQNIEIRNLIKPNERGVLPTSIYIKCSSEDGISREVCIPIAAFIMSKLSGQDNSTFNIEFTEGSRYENGSTLITKLIDESKLDDYLQAQGQKIYAKMKIDGTDAWIIWSLTNLPLSSAIHKES